MHRLILLSILAFPVFAADPQPGKDNSPASLAKLPVQTEAPPSSKDDLPVNSNDDPDLPEQPDLPASVKSGQPLEEAPEIKITRKGKQTLQEYSRNGKVYMIKVVPDIGPPYYFLDTNGDGIMDIRRSDQSQNANVNMWKLLEW